MPTSSSLVTNLPADFNTFGQAVDTSMQYLLGGTTGQVLSKTSATNMAFTWVTPTDQTPLTTKGDLFTFTTVDARLAVGANGETLVADSAAATGLSYQSNYAAGKNAVINGAFNVWQRGTTFTNPAGDSYTADRFMIDYGTAAPTSNSVTRQTFTPGTAPVAGYEGAFYFRSTLTTVGTTSRLSIHHKIENVQTYAGQTVTLSFFSKADSSRTLAGFVQQNFGSGGSATVSTAITSQSVTTAWTRFSMQVAVPSISGKTIGTSSFLNIRLDQAVAAGSVLELWGLQLEAGSVVTAFQTASGSLGGELSLCQRYYAKSYSQGTTVPTNNSEGVQRLIAGSYSPAAGDIYGTINFPIVMRSAPTVTVYSYSSSTTSMMSNNQGTSLAANSAVVLQVTDRQGGIYNNSGGSLSPQNGGFQYHYAASAEL
jgi:hypothetical protein